VPRVKRIFDRLIDEHGMADVSYQVVRAYVAGLRRSAPMESTPRCASSRLPTFTRQHAWVPAPNRR
jgi:hypothetical protein